MEELDDTEFNESEHDRLINAVSKLDKTQHIRDPTRDEPTNLSSEFNLIKTSNKIDLANVAKVLEKTAHHVEIGKKLKKVQDKSKVLPKPLEKPQIERIKRSTGYEATKEKVGRWDAVVARSRTVDYVSFPLKHSTIKLQPTSDFLSKMKLKSQLELELEEVDPKPSTEADEQDDEQTYPMTYEEMVERRQQLAKMRAHQSFQAAKAKRQSKIKSKKYHRILKKEKLKNQLKEFEELQKTNPEEALTKLEALEKSRALERHTLRHKSTGKWAKNKLVRAKYDKEVRQQLAEQLAVSRGLTQKVKNESSSDDEPNDEGIPDINLTQDPMNPWLVTKPDKTNVDPEFDFGYKKYLKEKFNKVDKDSDSSSDEEVETDDKKEHHNVTALKKSVNMFIAKNDDINSTTKIDTCLNTKQHTAAVKNKTKAMAKNLVATSEWIVESLNDSESHTAKPYLDDDISKSFDNLETDIASKVEKKLRRIKHEIKLLDKLPKYMKNDDDKKKTDKINNLKYLELKSKRLKPIIDEKLNETSSPIPENKIEEIIPAKLTEAQTKISNNQKSATESNIDPSKFIQVKPKFLDTALPGGENNFDQLDDDDEQVVPKVNIEEVFEEDDVVASFRQEKDDEIQKDQPKDIDLSLPGWGAWGGKGVKVQKRKRNRIILKAPPKMPRRDENKGDIIIKEFKNPKLAMHKVTDVPFPFTSVKDYEASIRAPIGNTFIPEKPHKLLIRPGVITKSGTIIEPMDEDELLVPRNVSFKNDKILRLLGQKK